MSEEKAVEYDYGSSLSLVGRLQAFCGVMAGFALTSSTVVLTAVDPRALLSQIVIFILFTMVSLFIVAFNELTFVSLLVSLHSPTPIIPNYPARWRIANTCMIAATMLGSLSLLVMLLLMDMIQLFVLEACIQVLLWIWFFYRWNPVNKAWKRRTREQLRKRKPT